MACIVRKTNIIDLPDILTGAQAFFDYAKFDEKGLEPDIESFRENLVMHISSARGVVLSLVDKNRVVGSIAGMINPWVCNFDLSVCIEFYWWVYPEYRGMDSIRLLMEFEKTAQSKGANRIIMISMENDQSAGLALLYKKRGYKRLESLYIKEI